MPTTPHKQRGGRISGSRRVFVGSASEEKPKGIANRVADALTEAGYVPLPWWHPDVFGLGGYTLESLRSLASHVDGAVFL